MGKTHEETFHEGGHTDSKEAHEKTFNIISHCACVLVTQSCPTLCDPWTVACQAPLSMEFSRQEYWSGLPCPSPGDLPDPGIEPRSPALQAESLPFELPRKPSGKCKLIICHYILITVSNSIITFYFSHLDRYTF